MQMHQWENFIYLNFKAKVVLWEGEVKTSRVYRSGGSKKCSFQMRQCGVGKEQGRFPSLGRKEENLWCSYLWKTSMISTGLLSCIKMKIEKLGFQIFSQCLKTLWCNNFKYNTLYIWSKYILFHLLSKSQTTRKLNNQNSLLHWSNRNTWQLNQSVEISHTFKRKAISKILQG